MKIIYIIRLRIQVAQHFCVSQTDVVFDLICFSTVFLIVLGLAVSSKDMERNDDEVDWKSLVFGLDPVSHMYSFWQSNLKNINQRIHQCVALTSSTVIIVALRNIHRLFTDLTSQIMIIQICQILISMTVIEKNVILLDKIYFQHGSSLCTVCKQHFTLPQPVLD